MYRSSWLLIALLWVGCSASSDAERDPVPDPEMGVERDQSGDDASGDDAGGDDMSADAGDDASADEGPFSPAAMQAAADYSASVGGIGVLIWHKDKIIFEDYANEGDASSTPPIASATKAFWAVALAAAMQEGLITDLDEPASDTITEWQDAATHPGKRAITLRQLTTLSPGLSQNFMVIGGEAKVDDVYQYVVDELSMVARPGEEFVYGPVSYYVFGVVLDRKLKAIGFEGGPLSWLRERVLDRIGLTYADWLHDVAGNPQIPNGVSLSARELVKLGILLLQGGRWDGEQIIETRWLDELLVADGPNPGHGRFLWLNQPQGYATTPRQSAPPGSLGGHIYHDGAPDMFAGMGAGKNRLYVLPTQDAVIVRLSFEDEEDYVDTEFFTRLFAR